MNCTSCLNTPLNKGNEYESFDFFFRFPVNELQTINLSKIWLGALVIRLFHSLIVILKLSTPTITLSFIIIYLFEFNANMNEEYGKKAHCFKNIFCKKLVWESTSLKI